MRRITDGQELLDGPLDDPAALRGNLRDLRRINQRLGGVRLSGRALEALLDRGPTTAAAPSAPPAPPVRLLDVGTGAADIPVALIRRSIGARGAGRPALHVTGLDDRVEVLDAARAQDPALADLEARGLLTLTLGDGRSLPYPDGAFDVAHCSLVVHHLDPAGVVAMLAEMARVARSGIVVNDLVRGRVALVGAWLLTRLTTRNRYTRHDAPLSVRRAYSRRELRELLAAAGLEVAWEGQALLGHRWAVAARRRRP
jgi:ubiquinone/menaquinone biosynthesis C-methylase UbiE